MTRNPRALLRLRILLILMACTALAPAQDAPANQPAPNQPVPAQPAAAEQAPVLPLPIAVDVPRPRPAMVIAGDHQLFPITAALGPASPADRASALSRKLAQMIRDPFAKPNDILEVENENGTDIVAGDVLLTRVTDQDSDFDAIGRSRQALAAAHVQDLRRAMLTVRDENSSRSLSLGALKAGAATLVLLIMLLLLRLIFRFLYLKIDTRAGQRIRPVRIQGLELLSHDRITEMLRTSARLLRFAITLLLLYFFVPLVFSFFARTRSFGFALVSYVMAPVLAGWIALLAYLPSLLVVLVIAFFAHQAHKLAGFLFKEIERGTIVLKGFYPEWAMPTLRIVEIFILAFALVLSFPYLPGSNSAAFRGVSIFLGVLLSLGSSSAIANVVAGVLLTYTRAFRIGDRVQIADTTGDVIEKTLLATHVRTVKNVDITIPNGLVLGSHIVNFSRSSAALPLILNTTISIGYDVPWRQVHELLIAAAAATPGLLETPPPFVLQTSLDDFYVSYQINAYTGQPDIMVNTYSALNQNIMDRFNAAGVEIMSPHYRVQRTNEATTVPKQYLTPNEPEDTARHPHLGQTRA